MLVTLRLPLFLIPALLVADNGELSKRLSLFPAAQYYTYQSHPDFCYDTLVTIVIFCFMLCLAPLSYLLLPYCPYALSTEEDLHKERNVPARHDRKWS